MSELALQFGTPLYVYSQATLTRHFEVMDQALSGIEHLICFAVKANGNLALLKLLSRLGAGADVVSGGELFRCLEAGIPPARIVYSGVGKTIPEIEYALRRGILFFNVESGFEMRQVSHVAQALSMKARISFRLNPDVDAETHPYIATGMKENKFGLRADEVLALVKEATKDPYLEPVGIDFHIGSQLLRTEPLAEAAQSALRLLDELGRSGLRLRYLDCGGGVGVRYRSEDPPSPDEFARVLADAVRGRKLTLIWEPGRALVANAGVLVTRVLQVKRTGSKNFVIVDAGMNDLLRPALYGAEHEIVPVISKGKESMRCDVVGPICETADFLARERELEEPSEGDLLCVRTAGAYGFSMSSQYNARPRVAEVLVHGSEYDVIRERETFDDLIRHERIPEWLKVER